MWPSTRTRSMPTPSSALPMRSTISVLCALRLSTSLPNSTLPDKPNAQPSSVSSNPCCLSTAICAGVRPFCGAVWHPVKASRAMNRVRVRVKNRRERWVTENTRLAPGFKIGGKVLRPCRVLPASGEAFGLVHRRVGGM
ncbi:hypothetical protein D3C81_1670710 [compost metagenome]